MKNVLILTYYWPPGSSPGVQRWLKFCKYLPEFGWNPIVITVENGSYPSFDASLLDDVPDGLEVIRTKTLEPFAIYNALRGKKGKSVEVAMGNVKGKSSLFAHFANYVRSNFFIPDARKGWNRYLYPAAAKALKDNDISLVVTTGPPHSTHLVGQRLQKDFGVQWIADFRDPWTTIYYNAFLKRSKRTINLDQKLENDVLEKADAIIAATPGLSTELKDRAKRLEVVYNGYDESDIPTAHKSISKKFSIAYTGNLKQNQNITAFWNVLAQACKREEFRMMFELNITGNVHPDILESLTEVGIMDNVNVLPFVPHSEAVQQMFDAHVLLLPIPLDKSNKLILTGKIFEYLATRRPIIGIGPVDGNAADIFTTCGKDAMVDYEDEAGMKALIDKYFQAFLKNPMPNSNGNNGYESYSRKGTTAQVSHLLNEIKS